MNCLGYSNSRGIPNSGALGIGREPPPQPKGGALILEKRPPFIIVALF